MAIDTVVEEVATNLEEVAEATRKLQSVDFGYILGGMLIGAAIGFYFGARWNKEKIKAEAFKQSELEIEQIRSEYRQKLVASVPKPPVEEIVEEKGYERPLPSPVPVYDPSEIVVETPQVPYHQVNEAPVVREQDIGWNWPEELQNRDSGGTYILHQDEFGDKNASEGYNQVTYTYYAGDGVLTDEDESKLPFTVIGGPENLKFGHGSDDDDVVFIRNEKLQIDIELCQTTDSWEKEVLGLSDEDV